MKAKKEDCLFLLNTVEQMNYYFVAIPRKLAVKYEA